MTRQPSPCIADPALGEKTTESPGNRAERRNASHLDGGPAVRREAKLLEAATQEWCLKLELYSAALKLDLNCGEIGTFGLLTQAQHLTPAASRGLQVHCVPSGH